MSRNIANKALILTIAAFLLFFSAGLRANAETRLYELNNLVINGNFAIDTNADGLADNFNRDPIGGVTQIINNRQRIYGNDTLFYNRLAQTINFKLNNKYYFKFNINSNYTLSQRIFVQGPFLGINRVLFDSGQSTNNIDRKVSFIWENIYSTATSSMGLYTATTASNIRYQNTHFTEYYDFSIFNLTELFGSGREPSLSDFELLYLPDIEWFSYYSSFVPETYTQLYQSDYPDLNTDLTGIDYSKSIISRNGTNVNLDVEMYFYDITYGGTFIPGEWFAEYYILYNKPKIYIFDKLYHLSWSYSNYSNRVIVLQMDSVERNALKQVLFNRNIDRTNEYFSFNVEAFDFDIFAAPAVLHFVLSSTFDLLVDAKSFLISREAVTGNDFNILNRMYIKTYDRQGNLYLPALSYDTGDLFRTTYVDNFGSGYTNISRFNFEFKLYSPDPDEDFNYETHIFYELGMFSSNQVIQIDPVDSEIGTLFPQQVCDWYQFGCHVSNIYNDTAATLYNALNIQAFIDTVSGIMDSFSLFITLAPASAGTILTSLAVAIGAGIALIIYTNATKED